MSRIIDASVLVKLLCDEPGTIASRDLFLREPVLIAPDIAFAEVVSALWKKTRRGQYTRDQLELAPAFLHEILAWSVPTSALIDLAAELSSALDHPVYDCLYLALAQRERMPLVSADARMMAVAARVPGVGVEPLC